jgi:hypothetical protein
MPEPAIPFGDTRDREYDEEVRRRFFGRVLELLTPDERQTLLEGIKQQRSAEPQQPIPEAERVGAAGWAACRDLATILMIRDVGEEEPATDQETGLPIWAALSDALAKMTVETIRSILERGVIPTWIDPEAGLNGAGGNPVSQRKIVRPQEMEREIDALIYELHCQGVNCAAFSIRAQECLQADDFIGLTELRREIVAELERRGGGV